MEVSAARAVGDNAQHYREVVEPVCLHDDLAVVFKILMIHDNVWEPERYFREKSV